MAKHTAADREKAAAKAGGGADIENDVVALLMRQHGDIRNLFDEVMASTGDDRKSAFRRLVRALAVHETAEEEVVHPYARRTIDGGEQVVEDRLREEREAKQLLSRLDGMDTNAPDFMPRLTELREEVLRHARAEERYEFAHLRHQADPSRLRGMMIAVKAAEAVAPTRPHPGVETPAEHLTLGTLAAVIDRTRDAMRKAMGKEA
jgi:hemerythrin superfamily protein